MADDPIEERLAAALRAADATVAVAEAATGGHVAAQLSAAPGASDYLDRGYVCYSYDSLRTELGVDRETLDAHGAVSAPAAREMARRARDRADATWGVATAGVAGPGGGTEACPVGTGFVGLAHAAAWESGDSWARAERHHVEGDRAAVREGLARVALAALREAVADG